jgi:hypothetical protein
VLHDHRLALPRAADDDVDLAALDVEVDAAQDVMGPEGLLHAAHANVEALAGHAGVVVGLLPLEYRHGLASSS